MPIQSTNPATGKVIKRYSAHSESDIEATLANAQQAYQHWRDVSIEERSKLVHKLADTLEASANNAAILMTAEMGKTLSASHAELEKCIQYCRYTANHAPSFLMDKEITTEYKQAYTRPFPLGVVLLVMPWNFPFWQVLRVAIAAVLAGNTCILKHASNVPGCALALEGYFVQAGFPKDIFQTLLVKAERIAPLIQDARIACVSITGSEQAGASVASTCGKYIKKCVLELGGSDPFIVMPSANIKAAVEAAFTSRMRNNGQSCIAAKRLIIHKDVYATFKRGLLKSINAMIIGDPINKKTELGPLASQKALVDAEQILASAVSAGATMTLSQQNLPKNGYFMRPGIIEGITPKMDLFNQEVFAPVAMLFEVNSLQEAVTLANDTPFGLSSVLFSNNSTEQEYAIQKLQAGSTYINRYASSDIRLPFGGIKRSGYGREMAKEGLLEFTNLKTVIVAN